MAIIPALGWHRLRHCIIGDVGIQFGCLRSESHPFWVQRLFEALEKVRVIRDRLATAYSLQKSYADNRKQPLEFDVGDQVYLKISPMKGVMRFGRNGKLSLR